MSKDIDIDWTTKEARPLLEAVDTTMKRKRCSEQEAIELLIRLGYATFVIKGDRIE